MNLDTDLTPFTKINSKWITDLNIKYKTIKLQEEKIEGNLGDLRFGDEFLDATPKPWSKEKKLVSWTLWKQKTYAPWKMLLIKDKPQAGRMYLQHTCEEGLKYKIYKVLLKLSKKTTQLKGRQKIWKEQQELAFTADGNVKWYNHFGRQ